MATSAVTANPASAWRPPQWNASPMVLVTVPPGYTPPQPNAALDPATNKYSLTAVQQQYQVSYVFDAVLSLEHEQAITKTRHPVQFSAAISSHAFIEPPTLVLYVLMSDVTPQYVDSNQTSAPYIAQFTGSNSKSVSAYQQMLTLQAARTPLTVTTRLRTYRNVLIDRISPREDNKTVAGARFRVEFGQVFVAGTQIEPNSARPNDTGDTALGSVTTQSVPATVDSQFGVHAFAPGPSSPGVPGSLPGAASTAQLPPDRGDGTIPCISNGVPGYLDAPGTTPPGGDPFTPQYPNSVTAVDAPGAGEFTSNNYNSLAQTTSP